MHPSYRLILDRIDHLFPPGKALNIVDYGCGAGYLVSILPQERVLAYRGYDKNPASIALAQEKFRKQWGDRAVFQLVPGDGSDVLHTLHGVDLFVGIGVLQYLPWEQIHALLAKASRCLKNDGAILLSCFSDHWQYRMINLYGLFLPHFAISRQRLVSSLATNGFHVCWQMERGLVVAPLYAEVLGLFVDCMDRILRSRKGGQGPLSMMVQRLLNPLIRIEYRLPIDFGYTLFVAGRKGRGSSDIRVKA